MNGATAVAPLPETGRDESLQVVGFMVADQEFAIDVLAIVGIERLASVLKLPRMPGFIEGVMRIRDEIVPLVKLRTRFGFPEHGQDESSRVIVIESGDDTIGFIVDAVSRVRRFGKNQVEPAPLLALTEGSHFVRGVVRAEDRLIVLLDPHDILVEEETRQLRQTVAAAEKNHGAS